MRRGSIFEKRLDFLDLAYPKVPTMINETDFNRFQSSSEPSELNFNLENEKQSITPSISLYSGSSEIFKKLTDSTDDFDVSDLSIGFKPSKMFKPKVHFEKLPPRKYYDYVNVKA